jgi:beta-glucosidase
LLKNEKQALPLDRTKVKTVAVYGPLAIKSLLTGGGSGGVASFHSVNFLDGITAAAGPNVKIISIPPPPTPDFASMPLAVVKAGGAPGLNLTVKMNGTETAQPTQTGVNISWEKDHLPLGLEGSGLATLTWTGFLVADTDSTWELVRNGPTQDISIASKRVSNEGGESFDLKKGEAVPISITAKINSDENSGKIQVSLRQVASPDLTAAKNADAVIVCVGRYEHEGSDRAFDLPKSEVDLIEAIAAVNPRTIVVNSSGSGVKMVPWIDQVPAVLQTWFSGQEGGTALGKIIFGDINPSGHLPMTFDRDLGDNEAMKNYPGATPDGGKWRVVHYSEGLFVGYRGYDKTGKTPLFPFGHGLSYTTFDFSNLKAEQTANGAKASLDITNSGDRDGAAVIQIYVGQTKCSVERPLRELKGFAKVMLKAKATQHVEVDLPNSSFAFWSPTLKDWTVEPGEFVIEAGASERDIRLKEKFVYNPAK